MKKLGVLAFILSTSILCLGQNLPRFAQANFAQGINNPAALALDGKIMVDLMFRNQWLGIDGTPTTGAINGQYELFHDMAVGLTASYDQIGVHHATNIAGQYSYRLFTGNNNAFIFGVSAGIDQRVHDLASAQTTDLNDPAFSTTYSKFHFNAGFGMYYYSPNFYFGASIPQFVQNTFRGTDRGFRADRWHYYFSLGTYLDVSENYTFNPNLQIKTVLNAPIQGDLVLRNTFYGIWSLSVGYRSENAIVAGFDFLLYGKVRVGYAFDYSIGKIARFKGVANELHIGVGLPYHNSRENFGQRKYFNKKGKFKRDFHKGYRRKKWYK